MGDFGDGREIIPEAQNDEGSACHKQAIFIEDARREHGGTVAQLFSLNNHGRRTIAERKICDYIEQEESRCGDLYSSAWPLQLSACVATAIRSARALSPKRPYSQYAVAD